MYTVYYGSNAVRRIRDIGVAPDLAVNAVVEVWVNNMWYVGKKQIKSYLNTDFKCVFGAKTNVRPFTICRTGLLELINNNNLLLANRFNNSLNKIRVTVLVSIKVELFSKNKSTNVNQGQLY